MKLLTAPAILSVLVVATLFLPAGAMFGTVGAPSEDLFDGEPSVEMAAHDGPNGAYVETTGDGELRIDITEPGVNLRALTGIERVFKLTNTDTTNVTVWVTHDGNESVTLYDDATEEPIDAADESVTLEPGAEILVSIDIDTHGDVSAGDELLSTVTLHAEFQAETDDTAGPTGPTEPGSGPAEPAEPTEPTEPIELDGGVEVVFDEEAEEGIQDDVRVRSVDPNDLDSDPAEDVNRPPLAVISSNDSETRARENASGADKVMTETFDTLTLVGEPTRLSGERSKIGSAAAISTRDQLTRLVEINVSPERANQPATVRLRVDRDRLGDVDGEATRIGHRTDEGWELLETRVVDRTDEEIIVEARTPGFSYFAVFSPPNVEYTWERSDGTEIEGAESGPCLCATPTFEEPGFYDVRLTVTDAFGRQSTATHRVLANDVPEATIEVVDRNVDEVTLRANVTDEIGETEVTWTFPDGTEKTGEEVTHTLEEGEHEIGLNVVDEYGAESKTKHTVVIGPSGASAQWVADALGMDLELLIQLGLLSTLGLTVAIGYRRFPWQIFAWNRRRGPRITIFRAPTIDITASQFVIDELAVEDTSCNLVIIEIEIIEDGTTVVRKQLDLAGQTTYTATPEALVVPPGVEIDPEDSYTVRVKATDENGRSAERDAVVVTLDDESTVR